MKKSHSRLGYTQEEAPTPDMRCPTTLFADFAAVLPPPGPAAPPAPHPLLTTEPVEGGCDVLCFHPRHDLTLARLGQTDIERIIEEWSNVYKKRGAQQEIKYIQIFEVSAPS